jgi:hypothetical protein
MARKVRPTYRVQVLEGGRYPAGAVGGFPRIAAGVHRGMNFRFHVPTAEARRSIMTAAGVSTGLEPKRLSAEQRQRNTPLPPRLRSSCSFRR